jgi:hypothetical protein
VSERTLEHMLEAEFANDSIFIGEVLLCRRGDGRIELTHRTAGVQPSENLATTAALEVSKFDDVGMYRPLRTAPNLRQGWRIIAQDLHEVVEAIDAIYPGRLAVWRAWKTGQLTTTSLRATLNRQSGMYRVAGGI